MLPWMDRKLVLNAHRKRNATDSQQIKRVTPEGEKQAKIDIAEQDLDCSGSELSTKVGERLIEFYRSSRGISKKLESCLP